MKLEKNILDLKQIVATIFSTMSDRKLFYNKNSAEGTQLGYYNNFRIRNAKLSYQGTESVAIYIRVNIWMLENRPV